MTNDESCSLYLDDEDGTLYLMAPEEAGEAPGDLPPLRHSSFGFRASARRALGPVDSPWTSYEVPEALYSAFEALADEWADQVADGRAYRRQVERDYRAGSGVEPQFR
jgi:hypothetical protein